MARYAILRSLYGSEKYARFRTAIIAERGNTCELCGKEISDPLDIILHHTPIELTPENCNDPAISLNPDNVKLVCFDCHGIEHRRYGHVDTSRTIYIVYGPPLAGKTSLVKQQARHGDLIVDIDLLYSSVSMMPEYDKPPCLLSNVIAVRDLLLDGIKTRYGKWHNAWVIGGYPNKYEREQLADNLGAELIFCDVSRDECLSRLEANEALRCRKDEWIGFINKWFERYAP